MEETTAKTEAQDRVQAPGCIVCQTVMPMLRNCWSEATRDHFRNSRIEFLKGIRSLIDTRIASLSRHETKGTRVTVE
jgi:predicted amidohydrolase